LLLAQLHEIAACIAVVPHIERVFGAEYCCRSTDRRERLERKSLAFDITYLLFLEKKK
jgi:hypothetical protein